jgi:hypothetical protein
MALSPKRSAAAANLALDAWKTEFNTGYLRIYSGTKPASVAAAITGTLLAELRFNATAFGTSTNGTANANAITADSSADATNTATHFRCFKSDGTTAVLDGEVGTSGSDLNLNSVAISAGAAVSVSAFSITESMG